MKTRAQTQFRNIPRNLAPFLRWISRFAAPVGIVKPPIPDEGAVPDAAEVGVEAGVEAGAEGEPDEPAVTVT